MKTFKISYLGKNYEIILENFIQVASILENKEISGLTSQEIENLMLKYNLYDLNFFESINKI